MNEEKFIHDSFYDSFWKYCTFEQNREIAYKYIKFGRENPETCEIKVNGSWYECDNCEHELSGNHDYHFCPYCGRKIIYET